MAYNKAEKSESPMRKKGGIRRKRKVCVFCGKDNEISYKDTAKLKSSLMFCTVSSNSSSSCNWMLCKTPESNHSCC